MAIVAVEIYCKFLFCLCESVIGGGGQSRLCYEPLRVYGARLIVA